MAMSFAVTLCIGAVIRLWIFNSNIADWLMERTELITPLTSWKRVTEGLALQEAGISPYSGDVFHEMTLMLRLFSFVMRHGWSYVNYLFIILDLLVAIAINSMTHHFSTYVLETQAANVKVYHKTADKLLLTAQALAANRLSVVAAYVFNPLVIMTCCAKSTSIFNNLAITLAMLYTLKGNRLFACTCISIATYLSLYPVVLIVPAAIFIAQRDAKRCTLKGSIVAVSAVQTVLCSASALAMLLCWSHYVEGSWNFLHATHGFILSVPDLSPNIGVFWYFFTEIFEHFRIFFVCVFQIHAFIYVVPLAFKLRHHAIFQMYILLALMAVFKSYPSFGDCGLYLSLLPLWRHVMPYMRNSFVVSVMFVVSTILAPVLWHLWIFASSANANFYFAITLVMCLAQVFLLTDLLFAYLRRDYDLRNGTERKPDEQLILD